MSNGTLNGVGGIQQSTFNNQLSHSLPPGSEHDEVRQVALELRRRLGDDDGVLVADALAEPAGHALVLLDEGDLEGVRQGLVVRVDHLDAFEGADVDAELAAGAELLDDLSLRDLLRLHAGNEIAMLVLDGIDRAVDAADRAVDAALGVDVVHAAGRAPDGVRGALHFADATTDTFVSDEMRHAGCSV